MTWKRLDGVVSELDEQGGARSKTCVTGCYSEAGRAVAANSVFMQDIGACMNCSGTFRSHLQCLVLFSHLLRSLSTAFLMLFVA